MDSDTRTEVAPQTDRSAKDEFESAGRPPGLSNLDWEAVLKSRAEEAAEQARADPWSALITDLKAACDCEDADDRTDEDWKAIADRLLARLEAFAEERPLDAFMLSVQVVNGFRDHRVRRRLSEPGRLPGPRAALHFKVHGPTMTEADAD